MKKLFVVSVAVLLIGLFSAFVVPSSEQLFTTSLRITVLDELGNPQEGARVTLFGNEADYDAKTNPVQEAQMTNAKGRVTIKGLEPTTYFVRVTKGDLNNIGLAVQTDTLKKNYQNRVNIVIE